jgi:hypothetical protein
VFVGASFAAPDVVACLCDDPHHGIARGVLIALFVIGVFLFAHGTYRGKLPGTTAEMRWLRVLRRFLISAAIAAAIALVLYLLFNQFWPRKPEPEPHLAFPAAMTE